MAGIVRSDAAQQPMERDRNTQPGSKQGKRMNGTKEGYISLTQYK